METNIKNILRHFTDKKILVIGDAILDTYIKGAPSRVCREAPVLVFNAEHYEYCCGGAANTAINVAGLGAEVFFLTVTGKDPGSKELVDDLKKNKVHTGYVIRCRERRTIAKKRVIASGNILLRLDEGSEEAVNTACQNQMVEHLTALFPIADAIILSDYGYGTINPSLLQALNQLNLTAKKPVIADGRNPGKFKTVQPTCVKPNYQEAVELLGIKKVNGTERVNQLISSEKKLFEATHAKQVVVTLDEDGIISFEKGKKPYRVLCEPADNKNAIGAGDTFVSALALSLASGANGKTAADIASAAAAVVVKKEGTARCSIQELQASLHPVTKLLSDLEEVSSLTGQLKKDGKRIVFTNGCFDIIHKGHISLLKEAKKEGDILIVGINSDKSVQKVKGLGRPINSLEDRLLVLSGLESVDYLVAFEEESPVELIKTIRPEVYVKGGNYSVASLREARLLQKLQCKIKIVPCVEDHSTSFIIDKIRDSFDGLKLSA